jgi:long-chain acyl-CoA synthetase
MINVFLNAVASSIYIQHLLQHMNFLENIFQLLNQTPDRPVVREIRDGAFVSATASELLLLIRRARSFLRQSGLKKGERCGLLAPNSIRWAALDLALMAEGVIVVPLYWRQSPRELVNMLKDCGAVMVCCGDQSLLDGIANNWPEKCPSLKLLDEIFATDPAEEIADKPVKIGDLETITIIYTSGTSGEPKGVMLMAANVTYMLGCIKTRLDQLMEGATESRPDQVFHYLPLAFAGSWLMLLSCLSRNSLLSLSTDLNKLGDELTLAAPDYCQNVPALLERIRTGVESQIRQKPGIIQKIYGNGKAAWLKQYEGKASGFDSLWFALANSLIFASIKTKIGANLKALICGSAPLAKETQLFFSMLGVRVLQAYGLTETTGLCTMDDPADYTPGKVGPAIKGIKMKLGEGDEILVRGPNIFAGYWNRPEATTKSFVDDWFRTGDQGEIDEKGTWAIVGRIKNLIILNSGHNIAPEPIEENLLKYLPDARQCVLMGNGKSFLSVLITGDVSVAQIEKALENVNPAMPHYKRIHAYFINKDPLTIESGLLTAMGKLRRDAIAAHFQKEFEELYAAKKASA